MLHPIFSFLIPSMSLQLRRTPTVAVFVSALVSLQLNQVARAEYPETAERMERFLGIGWGDGYHACRSSGVRPFADCPPRSYASQHNSALQRLRGCEAGTLSQNFYDRFDASCRANAIGDGLAGKVVYPFGASHHSGCDSCDGGTPIDFQSLIHHEGPELLMEPALRRSTVSRSTTLSAPESHSVPTHLHGPEEPTLAPSTMLPPPVVPSNDEDEILSPSDRSTSEKSDESYLPTKGQPEIGEPDDEQDHSDPSQETTISNLLPTQVPLDWNDVEEDPTVSSVEHGNSIELPIESSEWTPLDESDTPPEAVKTDEDADSLLDDAKDLLDASWFGQSRPVGQSHQSAPTTRPSNRVYSRKVLRLPTSQPTAPTTLDSHERQPEPLQQNPDAGSPVRLPAPTGFGARSNRPSKTWLGGYGGESTVSGTAPRPSQGDTRPTWIGNRADLTIHQPR